MGGYIAGDTGDTTFDTSAYFTGGDVYLDALSSPYADPVYLPTDPDVPIGGKPGSFVSSSEHLRDLAQGGDYAPPSDGGAPVTTFDWSQIGGIFTRIGQSIPSIVSAGRDVAAMATGRAPSRLASASYTTQQAAIVQAQRSRLLVMVAAGVALVFVFGKKGR